MYHETLTSVQFDVTTISKLILKWPHQSIREATRWSILGRSRQIATGSRCHPTHALETLQASGARTPSAAQCKNVVPWCRIMGKVSEGYDFPFVELITLVFFILKVSGATWQNVKTILKLLAWLPQLHVAQSHGSLIIMSCALRSWDEVTQLSSLYTKQEGSTLDELKISHEAVGTVTTHHLPSFVNGRSSIGVY